MNWIKKQLKLLMIVNIYHLNGYMRNGRRKKINMVDQMEEVKLVLHPEI